MSKLKDLTGQKFALLTVTGKAKSKNGKAYWNCVCECGSSTVVSGTNLRTGAVKSCGCLKRKPKETHHLSSTRLYRIWNAIIQRCNNKNNWAYKYYGAKGIIVCDEWKNDFMNFYEWAVANGYSSELTIDRMDNSKDYTPDNCKWSTRKDQSNNRSFCRFIEYNGETKTLMEWCEELNLNYKLVHSRIFRLGWTFEKAINEPVKRKGKHGL